jgi:glycosyltransferase involved in cell wall biosynthesis
MNKPKILILGKLPPPYFGPAIATEIILNSALNDFYSIVHFSTKLNESAAEIDKFRISKIWKVFSQLYSFWELIRKEKPVIALIPVSQSFIGFVKDSLLVRIAKGNRIITLLHLRGSSLKETINKLNPILRQYMISTLKYSDGVIVLGQKLKCLVNDWISDDRIFVVPNGGNYEIPSKRTLNNNFQILFISNLAVSKGILILIDTISVLRKRGVTVELKIFGEWAEERLERECRLRIINENLPISIKRPVDKKEKMQEFVNADLFVFPPIGPEGHPWVIIEAMSAGLPIIATDKGAITESVIEGQNGFIVPALDPNPIADKIIILMNDKKLRTKMGKRSREIYENKFMEKTMVDNLIKTFNIVLKQNERG